VHPGYAGILGDAHGDTRTYRYLGNDFDYLNTGPACDSVKESIALFKGATVVPSPWQSGGPITLASDTGLPTCPRIHQIGSAGRLEGGGTRRRPGGGQVDHRTWDAALGVTLALPDGAGGAIGPAAVVLMCRATVPALAVADHDQIITYVTVSQDTYLTGRSVIVSPWMHQIRESESFLRRVPHQR
jgi:hypothetical protein